MFLNTKTKSLIVVAIVVLAMGRLGWLDPAKDFLIWLTKPVFLTARAAALGTADFFGSVFKLAEIQKENIDLNERLVALETENAQFNLSASRARELEEAFNLKTRSGFILTGANVVSVDPTSVNQSLVIDRGRAAGLIEGQAAVDSAGAYAGKITRVLKNTAEVTLISDFSSRLPAEIADTGARGIVTGQHGLAVVLVEVPQGQSLKLGGRVVTTGFTPGVPAGLLIGHVESLRTGGSDLFQEGNLEPSADLRRLRTLFVITGLK